VDRVAKSNYASQHEVLLLNEVSLNKLTCWVQIFELYFTTVAYAENFHGGVSFSSIWWPFVFGVRCLWRHKLTSYSYFQTNVLAKFV